MRLKFILVLGITMIISSCKNDKSVSNVDSLYKTQLFKDVQLAAIYKDSKTFVDLVPKESYMILEKQYLHAKDSVGFNLKYFVTENFMDKSMESLEFKTDTTKTMYEHINTMWDKLTRGPDEYVANSSRIPLPKTYVVPGGRFQEIYYWDSYFTMEGLLAAGRQDLAKNMVDNFTFLIDSIGLIPNGTRDYYRTRSQPPFYSLMVNALARDDDNMVLYYLPELSKEYGFFMNHDSIDRPFGASKHVVQMIEGDFLNRYWDAGQTPRPEAYKEDLHLASSFETKEQKQRLYKDLRSGAESGWDFSSRWFSSPDDFSSTATTSILPVDLNCLLYHHERILAKGSRLKGDKNAYQYFSEKASQRRALIQEYMWDEDEGYYMDFNFRRVEKSKKLTLAGVYPMFFKIATREQASKVKDVIMKKFLKPGGLVTTLNNSGQQWDAPNGWAPLQWMAVNGLLNYGYIDEAKEIMKRWLALNEKVYKNTGKMMEKYNVEDLTLLSGGGEYETQDGFGWTNGVALGFKQILERIEAKED
ncbi:alpha,alpha-trehalase TreF [Croceitalea rosinachiae]|uniref:Alpha,alpha-trehalase TreF n=1 Tax=Croceitalea rosinachiae TaxID=3075596 RepID=A0ABU3ABM1_9FLAO|nr:alpha,alpha-trehalase TreF [Croceitalea sp. F388]MDT0607571.1 alpha,alpha-trehalase TreF [Croceitalea sp. F388]